APYGYQALIDRMKIKVDGTGTVYVNDSSENPANGYYTIKQVEEPTATDMPTITIRNQDFTLKAVKYDSSSNRPMSGVTFALYRETFASTNGIPDPTRPMPYYTPMEGYEQLVTTAEGVIPKIVLKNAENPDGLNAGRYYLREVKTPAGYNPLGIDIRITLSATGEVTIESAKSPALGQDWSIGSVSSDVAQIARSDDGSIQINVYNTPTDPIRLKKVEMGTNKPLAGVKFELYRSDQVDKGVPKQGEIPVISDTTDEDGIMNLGGLDGLFFLFARIEGFLSDCRPGSINFHPVEKTCINISGLARIIKKVGFYH
ncbi:MAG: prealbumin-like fold domain-containing protein, partial [Acutalibacteraceae bacterium]|nr:prealbumin-like fold domain-containing protein [Acutalibacteraceae bacterium]